MNKNILVPVKHNIISMEADAIVYSANSSLQKGSGMCKFIFEAAGENELSQAIAPFAPLNPGEALLSPAFNLPSKYLIHTVTPKYLLGDKRTNIEKFSLCYASILNICRQHNIQTLALPCLGIGHHCWPVEEMISICVDTLLWNLAQQPCKLQKIYLVCPNDKIMALFQDYIAKISD